VALNEAWRNAGAEARRDDDEEKRKAAGGRACARHHCRNTTETRIELEMRSRAAAGNKISTGIRFFITCWSVYAAWRFDLTSPQHGDLDVDRITRWRRGIALAGLQNKRIGDKTPSHHAI